MYLCVDYSQFAKILQVLISLITAQPGQGKKHSPYTSSELHNYLLNVLCCNVAKSSMASLGGVCISNSVWNTILY